MSNSDAALKVSKFLSFSCNQLNTSFNKVIVGFKLCLRPSFKFEAFSAAFLISYTITF